MTVRECIELTAMQLGIADDVKEYLGGKSDTGKKKCEVLTDCFNLVEKELALEYLPLLAEDEIRSETGTIEYSVLKNSPVRIVKVVDEWGYSIPFKIFPKYIKTQPGNVKVQYTYAPENKTMDGESDFPASVVLFSYGMAYEYCMAMGLFEESAVWDKKYKEGIESAYHTRSCERIRSRRWV